MPIHSYKALRIRPIKTCHTRPIRIACRTLSSFTSFSRSSRSTIAGSVFAAATFLLTTSQLIGKSHADRTPPPIDQDFRSTSPLGTCPPLRHNVSDANIQAAREEFRQLLGPTGVDDSPAELRNRSSTEWSPSPTDRIASLIVYPLETKHVSEIMKICHHRDIPVTPYSGGTSLDGALAATRGGICIDFSRMNRILAVHKDDLDVVVQPGVGWEQLNDVLATDDLFFPVDPGPGAQIGGMIATGCSGTNAYRYGPMKDWVISATIVLADGTIVKTRRRPRKSTAGYDLTRLMISSSGTLGLVTEAVLKVTAVPLNKQVAVVAFPASKNAVDAVIEMLHKGIQTEALELMDENAMKATNDSGYTKRTYLEQPTLFIKFAGASSGAVHKQVAVVKSIVESHQGTSFEASDDPDTMSQLWSARKTVLWNLIAQKCHVDDKFLGCDIAVPLSKLSLIIEESRQAIAKAGLLGSTLGHVGDANFHISILYSEAEREKAESIMNAARSRGIELDGTCTGEHGIGMSLRDALVEEVGETATDMMRRIKFALDPKCLLACDKVVRIEQHPDH